MAAGTEGAPKDAKRLRLVSSSGVGIW